MAISTEVTTKLPLARWARLAGIHPLHFEQVAYTPSRTQGICDSAMFQYSWQAADRVAREDIAQAISEAEELIERQLRFRLIPTWERDEWRPTARPYMPEANFRLQRDYRGYAPVVRTNWGYVQTGGVEAKALVEAGATIAWSDVDGDGYAETGTVVAVMPPGAESCEIEVYYPGQAGDARFQIRPARAVYSSSTGDVTVTFRRELCVDLDLFERLNPEGIDATDDSMFLDTVDIYRHYNDPSTQVTLMWDPRGGCACGFDTCTLCSYSVQPGCLHLRSEPKSGMVAYSPGVWNPTTRVFDTNELALPNAPDLVRLYYRAGFTRSIGCQSEMDDSWARAVTYLAMSLLERPICDCSNDTWEYWRMEMAGKGGGGGSGGSESADVFVSTIPKDCPWGTRRGAIWAWLRCLDPDQASVRTGSLI